jgi:hypothetical protein
VIVRGQALGEHLKMFDVCWDARVATDPAVFRDRDLAEVAVNV